VNCTTCRTALDSRATFCPICGATVPDPYIGTTIAGRFVAERRIAIGGFGSIYRGHELVGGRPNALKIKHREPAGGEDLVARFRREGAVRRSLLDAHTVGPDALGETIAGVAVVAMALLGGEDLLQAFRSAGQLPWQRALAIGRGICSALGEAHGLGIVHRDLKPANLFLTEGDFVKVLDFGIAKILSSSEVSDPRELTIMGTAVGTLEYMAPEQLMGGKADPRTDIYTLGVVMYEVITGRRPFNAAGLELLTEQLSREIAPASTSAAVPPEVDRLLATCLAPDVDDRFASAADLARAIDEALVNAPPMVAPPPPAPAPRMKTPTPGPPRAKTPSNRPVLRTDPIRPLPSMRRFVVIAVIAIAVAAGALAVFYSDLASRL